VGEVNGDGRLDLVSSMFGNISVLLGNGDGTFQAPVDYSAGPVPFFIAVGDLNADGNLDLAVANLTPGGVSVLLNTCGITGAHLAIARGSSALTVSWSSSATGFLLESTPSLSPPNWQSAPEVPATNNGSLEVSVFLDEQGRFFRLRKPQGP